MSTANVELEKNNKKKGLIVSLIFHSIVIALLLLPFLTIQNPPPGQDGILVSFGQPDVGQGDIQPIAENPEVVSEPIEEPVEEEVEEDLPIEEEDTAPPEPTTDAEPVDTKEEVVTDDNSRELALKKEKERKAEEAKKKAEAEERAKAKAEAEAKKRAEEEAARKAAEEKARYEKAKEQFGFPGKNNNSSGQGDTGKPGDQGAPDGDPNASNLEGDKSTGLGSSDIGGGLSGRGVAFRPSVKDRSQKTGKVRIKVCVNPSGKVTKAEYTLIGSNTQDTYLINLAINNAKKFKFDSEPMAPEAQCGHINFNFTLQ